jgi:hypothetical protein
VLAERIQAELLRLVEVEVIPYSTLLPQMAAEVAVIGMDQELTVLLAVQAAAVLWELRQATPLQVAQPHKEHRAALQVTEMRAAVACVQAHSLAAVAVEAQERQVDLL